MIDNSFASCLNQAQRNKNVTLREIHNASGISFDSLSDFRAGRLIPNDAERKSIVQFFGEHWPDEDAIALIEKDVNDMRRMPDAEPNVDALQRWLS